MPRQTRRQSKASRPSLTRKASRRKRNSPGLDAKHVSKVRKPAVVLRNAQDDVQTATNDGAPLYVDLFSGCGGLSLGMHMAGWSGLFAVERDPFAFQTLKANLVESKKHFLWPDWLPCRNMDIDRLLRTKARQIAGLRGSVQMIVGGPPCQGFSTAGRRRESDKRNGLIHAYLSFVKLVQPEVVLFENVRGFAMRFGTNADEGKLYSELVIDDLRSAGYSDAQGKLFDLSKYGVPQKRQRFIVIATRAGQSQDIIDGIEADYRGFLASKGIRARNGAKTALSDLERCRGTAPCPDSSGFESGTVGLAANNFQRLLRGDSPQEVPDSHRFVRHSPEVSKVFSRMLKTAPRSRCVSGNEREQFGLKKRSVTVAAPADPAPTITTIPDDLIHYAEPRVLTVRECARLQTFPDWFEFKGPYTTGGKQRIHQAPRYTQVGNAVPPLFAEMIGRVVRRVLGHG